MTTFLIDSENVYLYDNLLKDINNTNCYYPKYITQNLYDFFLNFIIALSTDNPLTLIDSNFKEADADSLDIKPIFIQKGIKLSIEEIIENIKYSKSELSIYTSGTTGQPKKVVHTIQSLTRTVRISNNHREQTWAFAYNPTHMAGLQVFLQALLNKNTLVNIFNLPRNKIYESIEHNNITHISATPTFYRLLLPEEKSYPSVIRVTLGGESSETKLYNSIRKIFPNAKINNIYASTEAGTIFSSNGDVFKIPSEIIEKVKVYSEELLIHKTLLGKSNDLDLVDNFYCTGDLIEWVNEKEGLFKFKGRKNELINIGGYKINPVEIENVIMQMPDIQQVVVFGKKNSILGNILCANVKLKETGNLSELLIRDFLSDKLQDFKIPRIIKFVDSLSFTRTGKTKRK